MNPPTAPQPGRALTGPGVRILCSAVLLVGLAAATIGTADRIASDWASDALERALITFATARALNGAISVAQSTEVAMQPAGVGVALEPGQLLDPVNDLIERFSWVMLTASASLGVQLLLVEIGSYPLATALVAAVVGIACLLLWLPWGAAWRGLAMRLAVSALVLRLALAAVALVSNAAGEFWLAEREADRLATVQRASERVEALSLDSAGTSTPSGSWWDSAREQLDLIGAARTRLNTLRADVEAATRAIVDVIAMYVLQTILLPMLCGWAILAALRRIWRH